MPLPISLSSPHLTLSLRLSRHDSWYVLWHWHPSWNAPLIYLITINTITFLIYAYDKHAARKSKRRIPERTLHGLALIGGSPAALLAQLLLRHKTVKRSFQLTYWAVVILQVALLVYLLT